MGVVQAQLLLLFFCKFFGIFCIDGCVFCKQEQFYLFFSSVYALYCMISSPYSARTSSNWMLRIDLLALVLVSGGNLSVLFVGFFFADAFF